MHSTFYLVINVTENVTLISPSPLFHPKSDFPKREVLIFDPPQIWPLFHPEPILTHIGKSRKLRISKKRAATQGISRKLFPDFFQILQFWGVTQGIFRKLFPGKFHEYLPMKKYFFPKTGHDSEAFPETFSNIWLKTFPEILLGHYPNLRNFKFHLKS